MQKTFSEKAFFKFLRRFHRGPILGEVSEKLVCFESSGSFSFHFSLNTSSSDHPSENSISVQTGPCCCCLSPPTGPALSLTEPAVTSWTCLLLMDALLWACVSLFPPRVPVRTLSGNLINNSICGRNECFWKNKILVINRGSFPYCLSKVYFLYF